MKCLALVGATFAVALVLWDVALWLLGPVWQFLAEGFAKGMATRP